MSKNDREYYLGSFKIENSGSVNVHSDRIEIGPISVIKQYSTARLFFRRTRQQIRKDPTDLSILWFVRRGRLAFSNQCGDRIAVPGDFAITCSMSPFALECLTDGEGVNEVLHITVPTHILRAHIRQDFSTGLFMSAARPELAIAENIFTDVFETDDTLNADSGHHLVETALTIIGIAVRSKAAPLRQTITDRRMHVVLRYIEVHLANPHLSTAMLSKGCNISKRYLSFLLRLHGTTFSATVWGQRLERAREWMILADPHDVALSEIAYGVGFKSPSHFSRMFTRVFGENPRDFRNGARRDSTKSTAVDEFAGMMPDSDLVH
jgi:AraC-like DNA-binding protein